MVNSRVSHVLLAIGVLLAPTTAGAELLTIDRVWGNSAGCAYLADPVKTDTSMLLLSTDSLERNPGYCEWASVGSVSDGTQVATGLCGSDDGSHPPRIEMFIIERDIADQSLIRIRGADGTRIGEVRQCP